MRQDDAIQSITEDATYIPPPVEGGPGAVEGGPADAEAGAAGAAAEAPPPLDRMLTIVRGGRGSDVSIGEATAAQIATSQAIGECADGPFRDRVERIRGWRLPAPCGALDKFDKRSKANRAHFAECGVCEAAYQALKAKKDFKNSQIRAFISGGVFHGERAAHLRADPMPDIPSGFYTIDLDDVEEAEAARDAVDMRHAVFAAVSVGGRGVFVTIELADPPTDAEEHVAMTDAVFANTAEIIGWPKAEADTSARDPLRIRFFTWDPGIRVNAAPEPWPWRAAHAALLAKKEGEGRGADAGADAAERSADADARADERPAAERSADAGSAARPEDGRRRSAKRPTRKAEAALDPEQLHARLSAALARTVGADLLDCPGYELDPSDYDDWTRCAFACRCAAWMASGPDGGRDPKAHYDAAFRAFAEWGRAGGAFSADEQADKWRATAGWDGRRSAATVYAFLPEVIAAKKARKASDAAAEAREAAAMPSAFQAALADTGHRITIPAAVGDHVRINCGGVRVLADMNGRAARTRYAVWRGREGWGEEPERAVRKAVQEFGAGVYGAWDEDKATGKPVWRPNRRYPRTLEFASLAMAALVAEAEDADLWDADWRFAATPCGDVIDLETGGRRPMTEGDRMLLRLRAEPADDWRGSAFAAALAHAVPDVLEREWLHRAVGGALMGEGKIFCWIHGDPDCGKSTVVGAIGDALGDYAHYIETGYIDADAARGHSTGVYALKGKRVTLCDDPDLVRINTAAAKRLVASNVSARGMRMDADKGFVTPPLFLVTSNKPPQFGDADQGFRARLHPVRSGARVPEEDQDPGLRREIAAETGEILAWAVEGAALYAEGGAPVPQSIRDARDAAFGESPVVMFSSMMSSKHGREPLGWEVVYGEWRKFCEETDEKPGQPARTKSDLLGAGWRLRGRRKQGGEWVPADWTPPYVDGGGE